MKDITTYLAEAKENFDKKFNHWILQDDQEVYRSFDLIKDFLEQTLTQLHDTLREEIAREIESKKKPKFTKPVLDELGRQNLTPTELFDRAEDRGFNQAITLSASIARGTK